MEFSNAGIHSHRAGRVDSFVRTFEGSRIPRDRNQLSQSYGVNQFRLSQLLHAYSMTRDPKAIFRLTRAPGTAIRSPAGTCIVRPSM
jgi:hypothetical protein